MFTDLFLKKSAGIRAIRGKKTFARKINIESTEGYNQSHG
jgi:hypothetical protein